MEDAGISALSGDLALMVWALSCVCLMRAIAMMLFMRVAQGRLVLDGYQEARRTRAVIAGARSPLALMVWDQISFTTEEGRNLQVRVHRLAKPHVSTPLVWYSPRRPETLSFVGPVTWMMLAAVGYAAAVVIAGV